MFISARVDRWSAAARLLIGASPPSVSHSHRFSLFVTRAVQPSCTLRPSASFLSSPLPYLSSFLSSLVSSSSSISSSPLSLSLFIVIFVLSVSPQLSAFLSFSPPLHRPYRVLRFSPCRPIIRSLFTLIFSFVSRPHTRKPRNLHYFPRTYTLSFFPTRLPNSDAFFLSFPWRLSKPRSPSRSGSPSHPLSHALEIFPAARLFLPLLLSIEQCVAIRNGRLSAAPQRQLQYLISIGKSDECYLYRHCP